MAWVIRAETSRFLKIKIDSGQRGTVCPTYNEFVLTLKRNRKSTSSDRSSVHDQNYVTFSKLLFSLLHYRLPRIRHLEAYRYELFVFAKFTEKRLGDVR